MFTDFLYLLRSYGMKTSLNEWNSLMDALEMNLNDASLTEFYYMARAVLVKKESEYDKFDQAFLAYFKNVQTFEELPKEVLDWLAKAHAQTPYDKDEVDARFAGLDLDDIRKMMAERLKEQHEQHHGGNKWIGTGGTSAFGHSGYSPKGIRVGGPGKNRSALQVAEQRNYRDFRDDAVIQIRQFQVALKKLRLLSCREDGPKTELNVEKIAGVLDGHQVQLMKDIVMLDKLYETNLAYHKELSMYILAGKKKLEDMRAGELPALKAKAEQSGAQEDAQAYNDMVQMCERFEKKLHDLELTRMISVQMGPQTRLLQNNDTLMVEKIQSSLVNTIPLWKSQMVLALGLEHGRQATAAQSAVTEMTNELLKKNADLLKMGTIETAKEAERSVVDIETLQHTNQQLISTLDEVLNIQREGAQKRRAAEAELGRIEGELKQKLLELRN